MNDSLFYAAKLFPTGVFRNVYSADLSTADEVKEEYIELTIIIQEHADWPKARGTGDSASDGPGVDV